MNDNKNSGSQSRMARFMKGKWLLVVLFVCALVVTITAWLLSSSINKAGEELGESLGAAFSSSMPTVQPTARPGVVPPVTASPTPTVCPSAPAVEPDVPDEPVSVAEQPEAEPVSALPSAFVRPVTGNMETPFSVEALVYSKTMADWRVHKGVDYAAPLGAKVIAAADGVVTGVYEDVMFGTTVEISHGGGLRSVYANLAASPNVAVGDSVSMGDTIGSVGSTALAEAADVYHLHFEMLLDDEHVDPETYFTALRG